MSVHRETLPSGRRVYRVRWRDGDRNRSRSFDRRAEAEEFEAAERRRQRLGAHAPSEPSRERLDAWLETWVRRDGVAWARSTRLHRAAVMDRWIAPLIGGVRLRELGRARCATGGPRCSSAGRATPPPTAPCGCSRRPSGRRSRTG